MKAQAHLLVQSLHGVQTARLAWLCIRLHVMQRGLATLVHHGGPRLTGHAATHQPEALCWACCAAHSRLQCWMPRPLWAVSIVFCRCGSEASRSGQSACSVSSMQPSLLNMLLVTALEGSHTPNPRHTLFMAPHLTPRDPGLKKAPCITTL